MTELLAVRCASAIALASEYLQRAIEEGACYDTWSSSNGVPPVKHSCSVFLLYFLSRALSESGSLTPSICTFIFEALARAKRGASFGYDEFAPVDADDTAFAYKTYLALGAQMPNELVRRGLEPFASNDIWYTFTPPPHFNHNGAFVDSYKNDASIWGPHPEVILNITGLLLQTGENAALGDFSRLPQRHSLLSSYHYPSQFYVSWLYSELGGFRGLNFLHLVDSISAKQLPSGSWAPFTNGFSACVETALALLSFPKELVRSPCFVNGLSYLVKSQSQRGGFPEGGALWQYSVPNTNGSLIWKSHDRNSIFSTSLCILAMTKYLSE